MCYNLTWTHEPGLLLYPNLTFKFSLALFKKYLMRKYVNYMCRHNVLIKPASPLETAASDSHYEIYGGYMLYSERDPRNVTIV